MSEKSFRVILVVVVAIWAIFVLTPTLADFLPRAWAQVQYLLPGDSPLVTVTVKDIRSGQAIADARVQIITEQSVLVAITDKTGRAVFESVPAGMVKMIKAQKLDHKLEALSQPIIPRRQRAGFALSMEYDGGRRLYVGHETAAGATSISMLDVASHLVLSPPGSAGAWENMAAADLKASALYARFYVLRNDRLVSLNLYDGTIVREYNLGGSPIAFTFDGTNETIYALVADASGRGRTLAAINARSGATRYTISVTTTATKAILLASPDGRRVYLAPLGENTISVYDGEAARRLAMYAVGDAIKDVVLSPNGRSLYVLTERRQIPIVIDTGAGAGASQTQVLDRLADNTLAGATRLVYAEYQSVRWLCILQPTAQQVALIDLAARSVRTIAVGREPTALAAVADSDTVYVTNKAGNTLSVISLSKAVVVDTIDVRSRPSLLIVP